MHNWSCLGIIFLCHLTSLPFYLCIGSRTGTKSCFQIHRGFVHQTSNTRQATPQINRNLFICNVFMEILVQFLQVPYEKIVLPHDGSKGNIQVRIFFCSTYYTIVEWSTRGGSGIQVHWQLQECHLAPPIESISILLVCTCVPPRQRCTGSGILSIILTDTEYVKYLK